MLINHFRTRFSVLFILGFILQDTVLACTLTMGYRSNERLPLIAMHPSNTGLYQHLFTLATEKIGCQLKIERGPKKRIIKRLNLGKIDFYPSYNFTQKRANSVFFIENGLPGGDIGISQFNMETITDLKQLKGYTLLTALGSSYSDIKIKGITIEKVREMSVDRAITLIQKKRGDFFIYNKSSIEYYLKKNNIDNIKKHPDCCGGVKPFYLGFSKKSQHYKQQNNPDFKQSQPISIFNYPTILSKDSIAYKFQQALKELKNSGKIQELYEQYYK